ncbi:MAG: helix-turn-helix transcriptional regulator [Clostridiaceae bacterium]|jgi:two-component system response regulator YesN|nr:helix-turn-helix transcriptional regulator [Clostridiaceae bacterium]
MLITNGCYQEFLQSADDYFSHPLAAITISVDELQQIYYELLHLFYPAMEKAGVPASQVLSDWQDAINDSIAMPNKSLADLQSWLHLLCQRLIDTQHTEVSTAGLIEKVIKYIEQNLDEASTRESVANHFYLHPDYLDRLCKRETGLSVTKQLEKHRLDRACELLSLTKLSIGDIANQLGFRHTNHLLAVFKRYIGMSPSEYRQSKSGS